MLTLLAALLILGSRDVLTEDLLRSTVPLAQHESQAVSRSMDGVVFQVWKESYDLGPYFKDPVRRDQRLSSWSTDPHVEEWLPESLRRTSPDLFSRFSESNHLEGEPGRMAEVVDVEHNDATSAHEIGNKRAKSPTERHLKKRNGGKEEILKKKVEPSATKEVSPKGITKSHPEGSVDSLIGTVPDSIETADEISGEASSDSKNMSDLSLAEKNSTYQASTPSPTGQDSSEQQVNATSEVTDSSGAGADDRKGSLAEVHGTHLTILRRPFLMISQNRPKHKSYFPKIIPALLALLGRGIKKNRDTFKPPVPAAFVAGPPFWRLRSLHARHHLLGGIVRDLSSIKENVEALSEKLQSYNYVIDSLITNSYPIDQISVDQMAPAETLPSGFSNIPQSEPANIPDTVPSMMGMFPSPSMVAESGPLSALSPPTPLYGLQQMLYEAADNRLSAPAAAEQPLVRLVMANDNDNQFPV